MAKQWKADKLYPNVVRAVASILAEKPVVIPVEVLMRMDRLKKDKYEDWRFGRVPYLEKIFHGNLSKANRVLRILQFHAKELDLVPSHTEYRKWGKGRKNVLRFSKYGDPNVERAYSCHWLVRKPKEVTAKLEHGV